MGRYTDEKYEYDRLTAEWFRSRGYIAEIVGGPGMADVVAWHPRTKRFAICEVKSPNEKDASPLFKTEYNVRDMSRKKVLEMISREPGYKEHPGLWRLYAFTVSSQLYTYWRNADAHLLAGRIKGIGFKREGLRVVPYIACCIKMQKAVRRVAGVLLGKKFIKGRRVYRTERLLIVEIGY